MTKKQNPKNVILAGGLTGGPIKPLLAVVAEWQKHDPSIKPILVDVRGSTSKIIAKEKHLEFHSIVTGKFRRYWSWRNFVAPILLLIGFLQSLILLLRARPIAVLGAGGFVQIPLIFSAWILRIPRFIHQQDVKPTLSNQICSIFANLVTTTFEFSIRDFLQGTGLGKKYVTTNKVIWTGNPILIEDKNVSKQEGLEEFGLDKDLPVMLVIGGGTGSAALNKLIVDALPQLSKVVQIIHSTGPTKKIIPKQTNYHPFEYISDMDAVYKVVDLVLARAGIGTLTELAIHKKVSIIVPMPNSHQELNAGLLYQNKAALVLDQQELDTEVLIKTIRKVLFDLELQNNLKKNLHKLFPLNAAHKIYKLINEYITNHAK